MTALRLESIRIDGGTQPRSKIDETIVAEYAAAMREGADFPAVVVFHDGVHHWLADGFHRFHAARQIDATNIAADVRVGAKRDAILYSVGANAAHGQRRTNEDKRRAVMALLNDPEWTLWSDREIARRACVHHSFASDVRKAICRQPTDASARKVERGGTVYTQRTENIGRSEKREACAAERIDSIKREQDANDSKPLAQSRGVGLGYAHKAISFLQQIPPNDGLRGEALDTVVRWIEDNR